MPASRSEGRSQSRVGQARHGYSPEATTADTARSTITGVVRAATGTASYSAVPPWTCRNTPAQATPSHAPSRMAQEGRGAERSSTPSKITTNVAVMEPASAVA